MQDTKYKLECAGALNEVGHIVGHFRNGCVVEVLDVLQRALVRLRHEVDGDSFTPEPPASSDPETQPGGQCTKNTSWNDPLQ